MLHLDDIAADPQWLPHAIDLDRHEVEFIRLPRDAYSQTGFLAERAVKGDDRVRVAISRIAGLEFEPAPPVHYIFHTAFCRSTLLVRALDAPGHILGMNEPNIVAGLAGGGQAVADLAPNLLALLGRRHRPDEAIVIKPTNLANRMIPVFMRHDPRSKAILMTNGVSDFLGAVARRGLAGRQWARQLFLELQSHAGMDFGLSPRQSFALPDMQTAALAWFLSQRYFGMLADGRGGEMPGDRFAVLHSDDFNTRREDTLAAVARFLQLPIDEDRARGLASGPVFGSHAKSGVRYDGDGAIEGRLREEIAQAAQWVSLIARQAGVAVPVPQTLLR